MLIQIISDTHGFHEELIIQDVDMIIHCGDISNPKNPYANKYECEDFLKWFEKLPIKHKILVAGNHDTSIEAGLVNPIDYDITYLFHEMVEIEGIKIFGSPYTTEFGGWAFNVSRDKIGEYWKDIPNCDILATHGPPFGISDMVDPFYGVAHCGDQALLDKVLEIKPQIHTFGHIHNNGQYINQGATIVEGIRFMNMSCVTDGQFHRGLTSHGEVIEVKSRNS